MQTAPAKTFDFAKWETIPVVFGSVTVTLAKARNMLAEAEKAIGATLSDEAYAEKTAIRLAINRGDWIAKGLTYRAPALNARQAGRLKAAVARIEGRLVAASQAQRVAA